MSWGIKTDSLHINFFNIQNSFENRVDPDQLAYDEAS